MSDDTPTQRFDSTGADAPTEVIGGPPTTPEGAAGGGVNGEGKSRRLLIILASVGGALLIAVLILLVVLLTRGAPTTNPTDSASPSPSPTPSQTPSTSPSPTPSPSATSTPPPEPEPTQPPQATGPRFSSFSAPASEGGCSKGTIDFTPPVPTLRVSWATKGTDEAWIVMGDSDAADSQFMQIPLNGDQSDFPYPLYFNCSSDSTEYTITLVGPDGEHVNKHWTVTNTGEKF